MSNIPSSTEDRKAILTALDQISESMSEMQTQREQIRETLKALEDKYKLSTKTFRKVAMMYHKQNVVEFENETSEIKEVYKTIVTGV